MEHVFRDRIYALKFLFMRQLRWILNFDIDTRYFSLFFSFIFMKEEEESIIFIFDTQVFNPLNFFDHLFLFLSFFWNRQ